jgi:hypothetical protein
MHDAHREPLAIRRRLGTLVVAALAVLHAGPASAEIIDRVMAVVGTQVVTLSDVRAAETFGLVVGVSGPAADVLSQLVDRQLMLTEVERYSAPDPDATLLDRRLAEVRAKFASPDLFDRALARTAMSVARLRSFAADNLRIETYLDQRFGAAAQPTPDEVQRYYREHPAEFVRGGRPMAFEAVEAVAQQKATAERKRALIADWLDRLRKRGGVSTSGGR